MEQAGGLGGILDVRGCVGESYAGSFDIGKRSSGDRDCGDFGLLAELGGKSDVDQLVRIVDLNVGLDCGEKVAVAAEEFLESFLGESDASWVEGIFVGKICDLQQTRVGKMFGGAGEVDDAEVVGGLEEKTDADAGEIGDNVDGDFGKASGLLQGADAGVDFCLGVGLAGFLEGDVAKRFEVAVRVGDEIDGADVLAFVDGGGSWRGELG